MTRTYCTEAGPVWISINGSRLVATYRIVPKNIRGEFKGRLRQNMVKGRWTDPDGSGPIYIFFRGADRDRYITAYRNDARPSQWHGPWSGVDASKLGDADRARLGKSLFCS